MELRCSSKMLHGVVDGNVLSITCKSRRCGKRRGVVVIHKYDLTTGELINTQRFQEPEEEVQCH